MTEAAGHPQENAAPVFPDRQKNGNCLYLRNVHYGVREDEPSAHIAGIRDRKLRMSAFSRRNSNGDTLPLPPRPE